MHACTEMTMADALGDPLVSAMGRADRVDPSDFEALLRSVADRLNHERAETLRFTSPPTSPAPERWDFSFGLCRAACC